jgi:hypothetical protein
VECGGGAALLGEYGMILLKEDLHDRLIHLRYLATYFFTEALKSDESDVQQVLLLRTSILVPWQELPIRCGVYRQVSKG